MADTAPVLVEREERVVTLRLHRPDRLNAVSQELYDRLIEHLSAAERDPDVRAVVLTGAGRAFCAGADLKAHAEKPPNPDERARYSESAQEANRLIQTMGTPVVAAVNGAAVGAGLELALSADLIVVAEEAKLRLPEVALGTFIGGGVSYTLPERVGAARAKEIVYLGDFFSGREAAAMGMVNRSVPADEVLSVAMGWAERLASLAPLSLAAAKRVMGRVGGMSRSDALDLERSELERIFATTDWKEGIEAFRAGREPRYRGE